MIIAARTELQCVDIIIHALHRKGQIVSTRQQGDVLYENMDSKQTSAKGHINSTRCVQQHMYSLRLSKVQGWVDLVFESL